MERMDANLWAEVHDSGNEQRRQLIDHVVFTIIAKTKSSEQISAAIKAFMEADLPLELIQLAVNIVLRNSVFRGNFNLQNLLILTAIKKDKSRVMDFINKLGNFNGPSIGEIAVEAGMFEDAFAISRKFKLNVEAIKVLLHNIRSVERAVEFACHANEEAVWSELLRPARYNRP